MGKKNEKSGSTPFQPHLALWTHMYPAVKIAEKSAVALQAIIRSESTMEQPCNV